MDTIASRKGLVTTFQQSLGDTVVLLIELKAKPGVSRAAKREIDDVVDNLQEIICRLPELANSRESFQFVFDAIRKAIEVWRRLFAQDG